MANPVVQTITATGTYYVLPDWMQSPFNLAYSVELAAGTTATYSANYTLSDPNDPTWTAQYLADPNLAAAQTATKSSGFTTPIRALQIVVTAVTGTVRLTALQGQSSR